MLQGDCPLPEWTGDEHSATHIEKTDMMRILQQPRFETETGTEFRYDQAQNQEEHDRFIKDIQQMISEGHLTHEEAVSTLDALGYSPDLLIE